MPSQGHSNSIGNALVQHPNNVRPEELDRGFERPAPKGNSELFNPKMTRRPISSNKANQQSPDKTQKDRDKLRDDMTVNAVFVGEVAAMSLGDQDVDVTPSLTQDTFALLRP